MSNKANLRDAPFLPADIHGEFEIVDRNEGSRIETWLLRDMSNGKLYVLHPRIVKMAMRTGVFFSRSPPLKIQLR